MLNKNVCDWLPPVVQDSHECIHRLYMFSTLLKDNIKQRAEYHGNEFDHWLGLWHAYRSQVFNIGLAAMDEGSFMMRMGDCGPNDKWRDKNHAIWMILNRPDGHDLAMELVDKYGDALWP
jgi:hypothetical protein